MDSRKNSRQIFVAYMVYFMCMLAFLAVRIISDKHLISAGSYYLQEAIYTTIIQVGIMVILPTVLLFLFLGHTPKRLAQKAKFRPVNFMSILISFGIGIVVFFLNIAISSMFNGIINFTGYTPPYGLGDGLYMTYDMNSFYFSIVFTALLPAICEEYLHRGLLLYETRGIGIKRAILFSSLLFGLLHFSIDKVFYTTILGILIGFVAVSSRSIFPAMIIHFTNNFLNVYFDFASELNWWGKDLYTGIENFLSNTNFFLTFLAIFAFLLVCGVVLFFLISKLFKHSTLRSLNRAIDKVYAAHDLKDDNTPIKYEASRVIDELIESNSTLNTDFNYLRNPIDIVLPKDKRYGKITWPTMIFLYASLTLGVLVTLATFIWGFL